MGCCGRLSLAQVILLTAEARPPASFWGDPAQAALPQA